MQRRKRSVLPLLVAGLLWVALGHATAGSVDEHATGVLEGAEHSLPLSKGKKRGFRELDVQAAGNPANATPGGTGNANILVVVTREGAAVDFLGETAFVLNTILVPPGGAAVQVVDFFNYGTGAYALSVVPIDGQTWLAGKYDIQVVVTDGVKGGGQTIASFKVE
ncbi:MAG: hypothetical protein KatS3mg131_0080 [Candidatus Tectimicrobiota bacterium]|nr:MAG: hypothetical protein KatS3mg131_0080 [Candidatus Tectomicrobia bacterium]